MHTTYKQDSFNINQDSHGYTVIAEGFDFDLSTRYKRRNIAELRKNMRHLTGALLGPVASRMRTTLQSLTLPAVVESTDGEGERTFTLLALMNPRTEKALLFYVRSPRSE